MRVVGAGTRVARVRYGGRKRPTASALTGEWRCCWCGIVVEPNRRTFEHLVPVSVAGGKVAWNKLNEASIRTYGLPLVAVACRRCNGCRSSQPGPPDPGVGSGELTRAWLDGRAWWLEFWPNASS